MAPRMQVKMVHSKIVVVAASGEEGHIEWKGVQLYCSVLFLLGKQRLEANIAMLSVVKSEWWVHE